MKNATEKLENLLTSMTLKQPVDGTVEAAVKEIKTSSSKAVVI